MAFLGLCVMTSPSTPPPVFPLVLRIVHRSWPPGDFFPLRGIACALRHVSYTLAEDEVHNKKRRMDLLGKAQVLQDNHPHIELTEQDLAEGITKHRFMSLRDETSSSSTLGFRIQGMLIDGKPLASKYFTSRKSASACRTRFHRFFQGASEHQKQCLYRQLQVLPELTTTAWEWKEV